MSSRRRVAWLGAVLCRRAVMTGAIAVRASQTPAALFDLAIVNARVIDGTGAPARIADVGHS